jgi:molybdopterin biosynthesis enzyme MoaB
MSRKLNIKKKNVNSTRLFQDINIFIESGLMSIGISWSAHENRDTFVEVLEEWLEEFKEDNHITQYKVICDEYNNPIKQDDEDIFKISISFKQAHCLNTTVIDYELIEDEEELITF